RGIAVKIGNLPLYHLRIGDDAAGAALGKKRFLELQDVAMLAVDAANKSLQRHFKFSSPVQPCLMHAVARTVNIAAPDALETHQNIAANLWTHFLELVSESDRRAGFHSCDRTETPLVKRPIIVRNELHFVSKIDILI